MGVKLLLQMMLVMLLLFIKEASAQIRPVAKPGCEERCGDLVVPYPFGIGANCSAYKTMEINCNSSSDPPKAFLRDRNDTNVEVLNISLEAGTIRINYPIATDCANKSDGPLVSLSEPFTYSDTENRFVSMGCSNQAQLVYYPLTWIVGGCMSSCFWLPDTKKSCLGINCCQTKFPPSFQHLSPWFRKRDPPGCGDGPRYAFIVDEKWFGNLEDINKVKTMKYVPAVLNWRTNGSCQSFGDIDPNINSNVCGRNAFCNQSLCSCPEGYEGNLNLLPNGCCNQSLCSCPEGYEGNPYLLPDGCQDIDECATATGSSLKRHRCEQICTNTPGNYTCSCKHGWVRVDNFKCRKKDVDHSGKKVAIITIATCAGLGVLLATSWWLYKEIMKEIKRQRKIRKLEEKFLKTKGGLLLEGNVETTKLFTSKELEKATDRYNVNRILGQGGQGTVYKGMLTDGKIVAVKKSKLEDETKLEHFINEVVILSQINHRNIVKLHGCCLETEVPLLVYEFIPNGTLMQYIHEHNEYFPLTWDVRVRVATEVAGALYYLHSAASIPIYHRDIKSSNILLDDKYTAKVADFGTSRSISIEQTHLTTRVQGTFGYLDPEYFQSSQFTDKSDVYSFGVVLVELLTGQKPILAARLDNEARGLAIHFLLAMEENRILDLLDSRITSEGKKEEMRAFANIAYRCLNPNGRKRPTMRQVVAELESIRNTHGSPSAQQHYEEVEYGINELNGPWESDVTSTSMSSTVYHTLSVDKEPLVTK